jgi:hypothetical protein
MPELSKTLVSLRSLAREAPELREEVLVVHQSRIIGTFVPAPRAAQDDADRGVNAADPVESPERAAPGRLGAPDPKSKPVAVAPLARVAQAERDKVLRRVARGGKDR